VFVVPLIFSKPVNAPEFESEVLRTDLRYSTADGAGYSLMFGMGEQYIGAFAVALNASSITTGLLTAIPMFIAGTLQLLTPHILRRWPIHRAWIVGCTAIQALSLLMMPLAVFMGTLQIEFLFLAVTLYWASGMGSGPPWNTWIEGMIPARIRARYFGFRGRVSQFFVLGGFALAGILLHLTRQTEYEWAVLAGFAAIFTIAGAGRLASSWSLAHHSHDKPRLQNESYVSATELFIKRRRDPGARLLIYLFCVQCAVQFSGPYFTPFIFRNLGFSYLSYMTLISICFLGKSLAMSMWGRVAQRVGPRTLLVIGGSLIVPVSSLWVVSTNFWWLAVVQFISGIVWASFELAFALMFIEALPRTERTSVMTYYFFLNSLGYIIGASLGALTLYSFPGDIGYFILFGGSGIGRFIALSFVFRIPRLADEDRTVSRFGLVKRAIVFSASDERTRPSGSWWRWAGKSAPTLVSRDAKRSASAPRQPSLSSTKTIRPENQPTSASSSTLP
jgi:MFS family permease